MHDVCFCGYEGEIESRTAVWQAVWARQLRAHVVDHVELAEAR